MTDDVTPEIIAQWMVGEIEREQQLDQASAVSEIATRFGPEFVYENGNGNPAIDRRVLRAFRRATGDTVVWERWEFCWRQRNAYDAPGRKTGITTIVTRHGAPAPATRPGRAAWCRASTPSPRRST